MCFLASRADTLEFKRKLTKAGKAAKVYKLVRKKDLSSPFALNPIHYMPPGREVVAGPHDMQYDVLSNYNNTVHMAAGIYAYTSLAAAKAALLKLNGTTSTPESQREVIVSLHVKPEDLLGTSASASSCCFKKAKIGHVVRWIYVLRSP